MKGCFRLVRQRIHGWRQSFCPSIPGLFPMRQWPRSSSTMVLWLDLLVMTHLAVCSLRQRQVHGSVCISRCIPFYCRHANVSRHHDGYGPEGQLCGDAPYVDNGTCMSMAGLLVALVAACAVACAAGFAGGCFTRRVSFLGVRP